MCRRRQRVPPVQWEMHGRVHVRSVCPLHLLHRICTAERMVQALGDANKGAGGEDVFNLHGRCQVWALRSDGNTVASTGSHASARGPVGVMTDVGNLRVGCTSEGICVTINAVLVCDACTARVVLPS